MTNKDILITNATGWNVHSYIRVETKTPYDVKITFEMVEKFLAEGKITLEEIYYNHLEDIMGRSELLEYMEDNLHNEMQFENFFFTEEKEVNEGKWVRVKTDKGYNVYFVKKAKKTIDPSKTLREMELSQKRMNSLNKDCYNFKKKETGGQDLIDSLEKELNNANKIEKDAQYCQFLAAIELSPIFVSYQKTKTQKEYLSPHQYELVNDIDVYVDIVMSGLGDGVKAKAIYTSENKDLIFYMQSRGISEERAKMLALLKQCHFVVEWEKLYEKV